jgi:ribokinase
LSNIFVIGSSNTDMVIRSAKLPAPGETILGGEFLMTAGGKGANQAVAAAKLGGVVTFACKVGDDIFGRQALEGFQQVGINTDFVLTDPDCPSGVALILVDEKGENSIAVAPGANGSLHIADLEKVISQIKKEDIVLIQLEIPIQTVAYAIKKCHEKGARLILNPAPAQVLDDALFRFVDIITPNETEAELLTGIKVTDLQSAAIAADALIAKGVSTVIITMGSKGAYLHNNSSQILIPSPVVKPVDSTAAGDVFNGALAVALTGHLEMVHAVAFACKAAAISVTRMGAQASAPRLDEL